MAALCWSNHEEIPHVQGKRNLSKMVGTERGHQRAERLKPQLQTAGQFDHPDHSLSNSVKLSHAIWGPPMYTLLCLKWITNKDLLYSPGNSAQIGERIWEKKKNNNKKTSKL